MVTTEEIDGFEDEDPAEVWAAYRASVRGGITAPPWVPVDADADQLCAAALARVDELRQENELAALIRRRAFQSMYAQGGSYAALAKRTGLSPPRIGQIVAPANSPLMDAFRAWAAIVRQLAELDLKPAQAAAELATAPGLDPSVSSGVDALYRQYWALLLGGDEPEDGHAAFIAECEYIHANLILWRRLQRLGRA